MSTLVFSFATFHATTFLLVPLLLAYRGGGLGQTLQGLNTLTGLGLFVALWVTTCVATARALRGVDLTSGRPIDGERLMGRAFIWGGVNAVMFLAVLAFGLVVGNASRDPLAFAQTFAFAVAGLFPGGVIAFGIGGLVGVVFAGIDLILLGLAARLLPTGRGSPAPPP